MERGGETKDGCARVDGLWRGGGKGEEEGGMEKRLRRKTGVVFVVGEREA